MRAIILTSATLDKPRRKHLVEDWPEVGSPGEGQFRTNTTFTGLTNGTERNDMVRGNYAVAESTLPAVGIAYQNVGVVDAVGPGVSGVAIGDRLFSSSPHVGAVLLGPDDLWMVLPATVPDRHAALLGMLSVGVRAVRRSAVAAGNDVLVVGAGFVGQVVAQVAALIGANVTVADLDEHRVDLARQSGLLNAYLSGDAVSTIPETSFEVVIDAAGAPGMATQMIKWARSGGRVTFLAGRERIDYEFNAGQVREITVVQSMHFDLADLARATELVEHNALTLDPLLDSIVPVEQSEGIYEKLVEAPNSLLATVFQW